MTEIDSAFNRGASTVASNDEACTWRDAEAQRSCQQVLGAIADVLYKCTYSLFSKLFGLS